MQFGTGREGVAGGQSRHPGFGEQEFSVQGTLVEWRVQDRDVSGAVAYVPVSLADQHRSADLAFVPVSDLRPSEVLAAWPAASRSPAVAAFVRSAIEVAAHHAAPAATRAPIRMNV